MTSPKAAPRILLLGPNGQVGWELQRSLAPLGPVLALDRHGLSPEEVSPWVRGPAPSRLSGDLTDLEALTRTLHALRPDVIVNAAAHTAVDKAESEPALARRLNAEAPQVLAQAAQDMGSWLVHYSTDYVFDGSGTEPWREDAPTGPLNTYGQTKLDGELAIQSSACRHLIFRTSWVYGSRGGNFAKTMLRLAQERERLTVIDDQWGAPTGADLIADVTAHALKQVWAQDGESGLYHLVAGGETTWHGYASWAIEQAQRLAPERPWAVREIAPVPTSAFPTPARRPHNSRLNTQAVQQRFGVQMPPWQQGVDRLLRSVLT